jgi:sarcosine oxidase
MRIDGRALFHPDSGRLDADRCGRRRLQRSTVDHGGARSSTRRRVISIKVIDDDTVEVRSDETRRIVRVASVVCAGAWTTKLLGSIVHLPTLTVTQEQPAHFAPLSSDTRVAEFHARLRRRLARRRRSSTGASMDFSAPGEGVKVGFHAVGPVVDPDERDFLPEPGQLARLQEYARQWLPGVDPDDVLPDQLHVHVDYLTPTSSSIATVRSSSALAFSGHGFKFVPAIGRILSLTSR